MNSYYPHIFEPITIGGVTFKNRIFTAPSMGHMIQNNAPTYPEPAMIANYLEKAKGGAAQIECGGQQVNQPGRNPIHSNFDIEDPTGWRNFIHFTNAIHFYDAKASYELIHFGSEGEYTEEAKRGSSMDVPTLYEMMACIFIKCPMRKWTSWRIAMRLWPNASDSADLTRC